MGDLRSNPARSARTGTREAVRRHAAHQELAELPLHHHPKLQHHFDDMAQQTEASTLGMWVFLVTQIMFFGGLFTTAYSPR